MMQKQIFSSLDGNRAVWHWPLELNEHRSFTLNKHLQSSKVTNSGRERKLQKRRRFLPQDVFPQERMCEVQLLQHRGSTSVWGTTEIWCITVWGESVHGTRVDDIGVADQISNLLEELELFWVMRESLEAGSHSRCKKDQDESLLDVHDPPELQVISCH